MVGEYWLRLNLEQLAVYNFDRQRCKQHFLSFTQNSDLVSALAGEV